jgi:hypothetical protein
VPPRYPPPPPPPQRARRVNGGFARHGNTPETGWQGSGRSRDQAIAPGQGGAPPPPIARSFGILDFEFGKWHKRDLGGAGGGPGLGPKPKPGPCWRFVPKVHGAAGGGRGGAIGNQRAQPNSSIWHRANKTNSGDHARSTCHSRELTTGHAPSPIHPWRLKGYMRCNTITDHEDGRMGGLREKRAKYKICPFKLKPVLATQIIDYPSMFGFLRPLVAAWRSFVLPWP